jgi:uncharacterized protein YjbJ (UPF0337 family)
MVDFNKLVGKAKTLAGQHGDKIDQAIDKSVQAADKATKGKYGDRLTGSAEKLKGAVDRVAETNAGRAADAGHAGPTRTDAERPSGTGPAAGNAPATEAHPVQPPVPTQDQASGGAVPDPGAPTGGTPGDTPATGGSAKGDA